MVFCKLEARLCDMQQMFVPLVRTQAWEMKGNEAGNSDGS